MSMYRRAYGPENVKELSRMIEIQHEAFVKAEHINDKAEALRLLRGYASEFLYSVPHTHKFKLKETERVLTQSVASVADFDPREASIAFEDLARYAHNLLEQPWRKEFYKLKLNSGYFVHNIKAHLQNSQEMLIALGYVGIQDDIFVLNRPADPVILKAFSRDCFLASQECIILSQIWERVQAEIPEFPLTVFEAYETRRKFMGDTTTIVGKLVCEARQRQHQEQYEERKQQEILNRMRVAEAEKVNNYYHNYPLDSRSGTGYRRSCPAQSNVLVERLVDIGDDTKDRGDHQYNYGNRNRKVTDTDSDLASRVIRHTTGMGDFKHLDQTYSANSLDMPISSSSSSSSFKSLKHHQDFPKSPTTSIQMSNPNDSHIEFSVPSTSSQSQTQGRILSKIKDTLSATTKGSSSSLPKSSPSESKKKVLPLVRSKVEPDESEVIEDFSSIQLSPRPGSPNEAINHHHFSSTLDTNSRSSSYSSIVQNGRKSVSPSEAYDNSRSLRDNMNSSVENLKGDTSKNLGFPTPKFNDKSQLLSQNYHGRSNPIPQKWACPHCTFLNKGTEKICEMCCKTRDFVLDET